MELYSFFDEHFIPLETLQRQLSINDQTFDIQMDRFEYEKKTLGIISRDEMRLMPCKSACTFLYWYMENSFSCDNSLRHFCLELKKYTKKIKKRVLSRSLRIEIAYRQTYKCNACGLFPIPPDFEVDHIIEIQDGGQDVSENLQALCAACHSEKTRLNRLRKNKIFAASCQHQYNKFLGMQPTDNKQASNKQASNNKQVFSKYFSKNTL